MTQLMFDNDPEEDVRTLRYLPDQIIDASGIPPNPLSKQTAETALLSEKVLRRDWDRPEEDKAWADL